MPRTEQPPTAIDFMAAVDRVRADLRTGQDRDASARVALELVSHGWRVRRERDAGLDGVAWDVIGTAAQTVADELFGHLDPIVLLVSPPEDTTAQQASRDLLAEVAGRLDEAVIDGSLPRQLRPVWATASGRLRTAIEVDP